MNNKKSFFCISYYEGDLEWINTLCDDNYIIYNKSGKEIYGFKNVVNIPNVGYNIASYLFFILNNYHELPETIIFCKNNVFPRHVNRQYFESVINKSIFTPIENICNKNLNFPASFLLNDNGFVEINNSWYINKHPKKYFIDYNDFFKYVFQTKFSPLFLRFSPGANYIVPKNNILIRSKSFYYNLLQFVSHSQFSCESHFVERSLYTIWNSSINENINMKKKLSKNDLNHLVNNVSKYKNKYFNKFNRYLYVFLVSKITYLLFRNE